jgi:hypothetical protein
MLLSFWSQFLDPDRLPLDAALVKCFPYTPDPHPVIKQLIETFRTHTHSWTLTFRLKSPEEFSFDRIHPNPQNA